MPLLEAEAPKDPLVLLNRWFREASEAGALQPDAVTLEKAVLELAKRYPDVVPIPRDWGGYALTPRWIEFWENREDRLHDRLRFVRQKGGHWRLERLAP